MTDAEKWGGSYYEGMNKNINCKSVTLCAVGVLFFVIFFTFANQTKAGTFGDGYPIGYPGSLDLPWTGGIGDAKWGQAVLPTTVLLSTTTVPISGDGVSLNFNIYNAGGTYYDAKLLISYFATFSDGSGYGYFVSTSTISCTSTPGVIVPGVCNLPRVLRTPASSNPSNFPLPQDGQKGDLYVVIQGKKTTSTSELPSNLVYSKFPVKFTTPKADLIVSSIVQTATSTYGVSWAKFNVTLVNVGSRTTATTSIAQVILDKQSSAPSYSAAIVPILEPGQTYQFDISCGNFCSPAHWSPGSHTFSVVADFGNKILESNESNNSKTVSFTTYANGIDLVSSLSYWPIQINTSTPVLFYAYVKNQGIVTAPSSYLQFGSTGVVGQSVFAVPALTAGQTYTATRTIMFSSAGYWTVSSMADAYGKVVETDEQNNSSFVGINVLAEAESSSLESLASTLNSAARWLQQLMSLAGVQ